MRHSFSIISKRFDKLSLETKKQPKRKIFSKNCNFVKLYYENYLSSTLFQSPTSYSYPSSMKY